MHSKPLVTVSLPVFNGADTLADALDSILAQTYQTLEIIVSDNASTDDTFAIAEKYAKNDTRIIMQRHSENLGIYKNSRSIWDRASGKYILFSGCDDTWHKDFIAELVDALESNPDAALAACRAQYYNENGEFLNAKPLKNLVKPTIKQAIQRLYHLLYFYEQPKNYNRYILGLFRLDLLKKFIATYPDIPGDTSFLAAFACDYGFVFVDKPLMNKIKNDKPFRERYKDDPYSVAHRKATEDKIGRIKIDIQRLQYLFTTDFVSLKSKVFVLPVVTIIVFTGLSQYILGYFLKKSKNLIIKNKEKAA